MGMGSVWPAPANQYTQDQLAQALAARLPAHRELVEACYGESRVQQRGINTSLDTLRTGVADGSASDELKAELHTALQDMLCAAAAEALREWGGDAACLTHVIFGSSFGGCFAPSHEVAVIERLELPITVQRVSFDHLESLGGLRVVALASELACASSAHRVLVLFGDVGSARSCFLPESPAREDILRARV